MSIRRRASDEIRGTRMTNNNQERESGYFGVMSDLLTELQSRGMVQDHTPGLAARLARGPVTAYVGFDPTANSLHVGNLVPVMALAWLQRLGGRPLVITGGGTGMVGDPSGKRAERPMLSVEEIDATASRYERSGLSEAEASALKAALLSLMMKAHPYRDPDLTLSNLAEQLKTTPHKLSEVLNTEVGQTFYDFINRYRVDDVRRRLAESRHVNVLTVAMDAGFASKSTFNQVFKKQTGQTPSTYRKAMRLTDNREDQPRRVG